MMRAHEPPFTEKEIELLTMMGTIGSSALRRLETRGAQENETGDITEFHGIIGASKPIKAVYSQIRMAGGNAATVLIEGESGTGKELIARAIHAAGERAKGPFIPVDCGAIPETLIEAELFGAKKGSYTGAVADRAGLFEAANGGTIFLDEISNTTSALQAKLLRVIQEREVETNRGDERSQNRCPPRCRLQSEPGSAGRGRPVPQGSSLSTQGPSHSSAGAARAPR